MRKGKRQRIEVDGTIFDSMADGARSIGMCPKLFRQWADQGDERRINAQAARYRIKKKAEERRSYILAKYGSIENYLQQTSKFTP